jgi:hypothetical protein
VNNQTVFNLSSLYANGLVVYSNANEGTVAMQKSIDDNPESGITIAPSQNESGLVIQYGDARQIQRLSVFADPAAKGRLDFFLVDNASTVPAPVTSNTQESQYIKASNPQTVAPAAADTTTSGPVSLDKMTPTVTLVLDGSNGRGSIDFPAVTASKMIVRWTPQTAGESVAIREINSFGDFSLNDYELVPDPSAVAEQLGDVSKDGKDFKDKQGPDPVGELLPGKNPFMPAGLGFPPNLTRVVSP